MFYKLLGWAVWKGIKGYVRQRYGDRPEKVLAGTVVGLALAAGVVAALRQRSE